MPDLRTNEWIKTPQTGCFNQMFAVMSGTVDMHYREHGQEHVVRLQAGDIFFAGIGTEHVAHPQGEVRILVIEKEDSV